MKDLAIIRTRILFLGVMGSLALVGAVVLIVVGHAVEGMALFAVTTTAVGTLAGAPRSADTTGPTAGAPAPAPSTPPAGAPPAPAPVEQVTEATLVDWIATAEKWGPDNLEAH